MTQPPRNNRIEADEAFLTRLVAEHAALLYRVAYAVLRHAQDAEDAVQDALLKLHRAGTLPDLENERGFLSRIVWRTALDRLNARRLLLDDPALAFQLADTRPDPESTLADSDEQALLGCWIEELPEELRHTLRLAAVEGLNSREAGEVLGIPEATVRTRLHRARALLHERFAQLNTRRGRTEVAATTEGRNR